MVYCFTMNGRFPADAYWPEYYHCALPGPEQEAADWLRLKASYSNGLFFPIAEMPCWLTGALSALLSTSITINARSDGHPRKTKHDQP